jgi:hypothetical protein
MHELYRKKPAESDKNATQQRLCFENCSDALFGQLNAVRGQSITRNPHARNRPHDTLHTLRHVPFMQTSQLENSH